MRSRTSTRNSSRPKSPTSNSSPNVTVTFRKPANMGAVMSELGRINAELAKSAGEGLPVTPLTPGNMSDVKT